MSTDAFSCFLIGADTLLTECGEILLAKNHTISGVVTNAARIRQWAVKKQIPVIEYQEGYEASLVEQPFDYLFSITHLRLIEDEILALPQKGAINFHDGPLPAYAGLNTPAWALINGEQRYGISWHTITPGVDKGDILKQQLFEISSDESSVSINTKCFAAAIESFPALVDELTNGTTNPIQQDFTERSYYGRYDRPDANGLIQWQQSAKSIERLVRAMDFGDHLNLLVLPKIVIKDQVFAVLNARVSEQASPQSAGKVVAIGDTHIDVATGDGVLSISSICHLNGSKLSIKQLQDNFRLELGEQLLVDGSEELQSVTKLANFSARSDAYWLQRLSYLEPVELPYSRNHLNSDTITDDYNKLEIADFAEVCSELEPTSATETVITAFALLLSRLTRKDEFDIALESKLNNELTGLCAAIFSNSIVLHLDLDWHQNAPSVITQVANEIKSLDSKNIWAKDLIGRCPTLRNIPELVSDTALPVGISIATGRPITGTDFTLAISENGRAITAFYKAASITHDRVLKLTQQLKSFVVNLIQKPLQPVSELELLTQQEKHNILVDWNSTEVEFDSQYCVQHLFEQKVLTQPDAIALVFNDQQISYAELNNKANQLATELIQKGVGPDDMVGVNITRSIYLMIATIAVHKAGAAYVPLDPDFPADRISYMINDSAMELIISQTDLESRLTDNKAEVICIDDFNFTSDVTENPDVAMTSANLAYVIYTSGSTGKPKGVLVEHRNVCNFFHGMDQCIEHENAGTWFAVTSLSFDISVLELFWTLSRGFKVIIYREDRGKETTEHDADLVNQPMEFGLFMWGNDDAPGSEKYRLLIEGAKYFDSNGFNSVWTPERHFGAFGGPYPNPAVTSAAIATVTKNISIRSGSIVAPLHHPVRIAEDWAVIDNLSDGRVALSFAAGWQPNDFVIMPQNHKNNKQVMMQQIDIVRRLWRGEKVAFENPMGDMVETQTLPRPVQKELPLWFTAAGNPESYRLAGEMGMNLLTHLLGQDINEVADKIKIYRNAREEAGYDPDTGKVTLMLHTFVGENDDDVREIVRQPMKDYLQSAMRLVINFAWSFPAFKRPGGQDSSPDDIDLNNLSDAEVDTILDFAFERYFETSGLFGTPETCLKMVNRCKQAGINEIACLLDFGVETDRVMDSLPLLKDVRDLSNPISQANTDRTQASEFTFAEQMAKHSVTHFQCTPSMAHMLCFDNDAKQELAKLKHMMVGGEAFPTSLAKNLKDVLNGRLTNMYGPTETTIWSTTHEVANAANIPIGRPIANTDIYILDKQLQPVPAGIAGDLYIGGQGVVRGYHNRPELTAERFVSNPFKDGERIYWTGDLAKYRDDGVIEFLGRIDHQVKIRGYRIELGEIEAQLIKHESVSECVLLLREDNPGDQRLVAYFVAAHESPDPTSIREHLRINLPEYMVPNDVVELEAMPLTPNGKLDRKQLPIPQHTQSASTTDYEAPKDEVQQIIVNVWQQTLKLDKVGIKDNFFDLGGHSLLVIMIHHQLQEQLSIPISLTDLYRFPTIESLTNHLNSADTNESLKKSSDRASRRRERMGLRKRGRK